jgi:DNA-binding NtrC family response regulator
MAEILVIHQEDHVIQSVVDDLRRHDRIVVEIPTLPAMSSGDGLATRRWDLIVVVVPRQQPSTSAVRRLKEKFPAADVVVVGETSNVRQVIETMREGAAEYLARGTDRAQLVAAFNVLLQRRAANGAARLREAANLPIAIDIATRTAFAKAERAAAAPSTVLITGESGTGKEVVARFIHRHSASHRGSFVPVNCGSIPETLIETELFGYRKGAFTGALGDTKGLIEQAEHGVLFLDEIGDMPYGMQVKLLRFLDGGEIRPIGGTAKHVAVRVIAATNRSLVSEIVQRRFREDLYFRLNVISIHLPPLRERRSDIPALVAHHLERAAANHRTATPTVSDEALSVLVRYAWPGNVRELQNVVEQALIEARGGTIMPTDLPSHLGRPSPWTQPSDESRGVALDVLTDALRRHQGNHTNAAAALGISRTTLWRRLRQLKPSSIAD